MNFRNASRLVAPCCRIDRRPGASAQPAGGRRSDRQVRRRVCPIRCRQKSREIPVVHRRSDDFRRRTANELHGRDAVMKAGATPRSSSVHHLGRASDGTWNVVFDTGSTRP